MGDAYKAALRYGAEVAIRCKEDYGLTIDTYDGQVWADLFDEFSACVTVAQAAFIVANGIQKRGARDDIKSGGA